MCVSTVCDPTTTNCLQSTGVNGVFFKRHLKLFDVPENIGNADLSNQNLRTSPVAPQQTWKANITFSNGNGFLAPYRDFFCKCGAVGMRSGAIRGRTSRDQFYLLSLRAPAEYGP